VIQLSGTRSVSFELVLFFVLAAALTTTWMLPGGNPAGAPPGRHDVPGMYPGPVAEAYWGIKPPVA
jgi:hypothetical protein